MAISFKTQASRILRGVLAISLGVVVLGIALLIIFWDADFYTARDKYEHFKAALFGDWQADHWCPPGRVSDDCKLADSFEAALKAASDFTFFRSMPIEATSLNVQTGLRFATARDVVAGSVAAQWCYVSLPGAQARSGISQRIELATQSAGDPPIYPDLMRLDVPALAGTGLTSPQLVSLAQSHCRFDPIWLEKH